MGETGTSAVSDADLIARAQHGQVEAFGELYRRYLDPIYRYVRMRVNAESDAEDISERVFLRTFEALDRYEERGHPFSAYLYRVARNLLVDHYRRQPASVGLEEATDVGEVDSDPDTVVIRREEVRQISEAIEQLPEDYREVIRLRVVLELPNATVAAWMERSPGAVRVLLHRALKALREGLSEGAD